MMQLSTVSIAMCTYNAERFLDEQLESFLVQTVLPRELVVQDDCSTDGTIGVLERFAERAPFAVRIEQNPRNLGPTGNFEAAMQRCTCDVVVFSDADDEWLPERIEAALAVLNRDPAAGCVFADADLVDAQGQPLGRTLWGSIGFTERDRRAVESGRVIDALLRRTIGFGGTMAVRRTLFSAVLPIPRPWGHDNWTACIAAGLTKLALVPRPLIRYRQHGANYSGGDTLSIWRKLEQRRRTVAPSPGERDWVPRAVSFDHLAARLRAHRSDAADPTRLDTLVRHAERKARHLERRERLPPALLRRTPTVLADAIRLDYHRYSNGLSSVAHDLLFGRV